MKPFKSQAFLQIGVVMLVLVTIACGGSVTSIPAPDRLATTVAQTLQPIASLASPVQPTSTPLPSSTPVLATNTSIPPSPTATTTKLPAAMRINFAAGATYGVAQGAIQAGQTVSYVAGAAKGQPMIVMLSTPDQTAVLSVVGANGTVLLSSSQKSTGWQGTLPATQDYYFRITGQNTQNFTLTVNIPARVQFASGQNVIALSGQTVGGYNVAYAAYAFGGQQLDVTIDTAPEVAALTIWGFSDGQPYARAQNGVTHFSMALPSTQDYIIEVVPQGGNVVNYQVTITIQ